MILKNRFQNTISPNDCISSNMIFTVLFVAVLNRMWWLEIYWEERMAG